MSQYISFVINHWPLFIALLVTLVLIFLNEMMSQKNKAPALSTRAAIDKINHESAVVIDLRDKDIYAKAHIIGAIHGKREDFLNKRFDKYKDMPIILVCAQGIQSASLANELKTLGFHHASTLTGGIASWQADGLPLIKSKK